MRKVQMKSLYAKLTEFCGRKVQIMNVEGWTDKEISDEAVVSQNRLSEMKGFKKYRRNMQEKTLIAFLMKGLITVDEILQKVDLTENERKYIGDLKYFETPKVRRLLSEIEGKIAKTGKSLEAFLEEIDKGLEKKRVP